MRRKREWLLGMDLLIGSDHGFKCYSANALKECVCVCVSKKEETGREKGRCCIDGMPRFSSLSWIIMILSWWDAASKRWEYAWTVSELEPAYELAVAQPSSHPCSQAWEFLNSVRADISERGTWVVVGLLEHFCIFLDAHTCCEIDGLMLIKWRLEFAFVCVWQFSSVCRGWGPERETDSVRLGWQVSRRLLQAAMLPFDTTGFVELTGFFLFFSSLYLFPSLSKIVAVCM